MYYKLFIPCNKWFDYAPGLELLMLISAAFLKRLEISKHIHPCLYTFWPLSVFCHSSPGMLY